MRNTEKRRRKMKKIICSIKPEFFELFLVELNGYGFEILSRQEKEIKFSIYAQDEEFTAIKEMIESIFSDIGDGEIVDIVDIKEENWEEKWKENFKPIKVGKFIIIPEWEVYEGKDLIPIKIKVAMAFGTGLHPTTQLVLRLIPEFVKEGDTVLDIGCGTGILSIAAAKIGAKVDAFDIDSRAVEECRINSWENEVEVNCFKSDIKEDDKIYDVVISNIQMDVFDKVFDIIAKKFKKFWILSGIFKDEEKEKILQMAQKNNLKAIRIEHQSEEGREDYVWYGFVFQHQ